MNELKKLYDEAMNDLKECAMDSNCDFDYNNYELVEEAFKFLRARLEENPTIVYTRGRGCGKTNHQLQKLKEILEEGIING